MCKPKSEGGQRCHAHTRTRFQDALIKRDLAAAGLRSVGGPRQQRLYDRACAQVVRAGTDLASTEQGLAEIRALATQAATIGDQQTAGLYDHMAEQGQRLREVNAAVRAAAKTAPALPDSVLKSTRANLAAIRGELDAQGEPVDSPLRAVLAGTYGSHVLVARDPAGRVVGGIDALVTGTGRNASVHIKNMRVMTKRQGHGQRLIAEAARLVGAKGELSVGGAISSAMPFYAKTGASFQPHSSRGEWSPEAVTAMQRGEVPPPGEVVTREEAERRERERLREQYPDYYREKYGADA